MRVELVVWAALLSALQADPQSGTQLVSDEALSLYVEFNVAYRLNVADTTYMPASEAKVRACVCARALRAVGRSRLGLPLQSQSGRLEGLAHTARYVHILLSRPPPSHWGCC